MADIFDIIVKEAGEFYKQVVTVAISFLGGTLIFADKIAANPIRWPGVLFLGWGFLIVSIIFVTLVRWKNIESGTLMLRDDPDRAKKLDKRKETWTAIASIALVLGIMAIVVFGAINIYYKNG